jgi:hypothetical protein
LHRKVQELQRFESIARAQQDCELLLASTREKHEQELIHLNESLQLTQMNLQEKVRDRLIYGFMRGNLLFIVVRRSNSTNYVYN